MKPPANCSIRASLGTILSNRGSSRTILPNVEYLSAAPSGEDVRATNVMRSVKAANRMDEVSGERPGVAVLRTRDKHEPEAQARDIAKRRDPSLAIRASVGAAANTLVGGHYERQVFLPPRN